jgi:hypothetical protein
MITAPAADHFRVADRGTGHRAAAACCHFTVDVDVVFDRDRDAQQRQPLAGVETVLCGRGFLARGLHQHRAVAAQLRIQACDAFQVKVQ